MKLVREKVKKHVSMHCIALQCIPQSHTTDWMKNLEHTSRPRAFNIEKEDAAPESLAANIRMTFGTGLSIASSPDTRGIFHISPQRAAEATKKKKGKKTRNSKILNQEKKMIFVIISISWMMCFISIHAT